MKYSSPKKLIPKDEPAKVNCCNTILGIITEDPKFPFYPVYDR